MRDAKVVVVRITLFIAVCSFSNILSSYEVAAQPTNFGLGSIADSAYERNKLIADMQFRCSLKKFSKENIFKKHVEEVQGLNFTSSASLVSKFSQGENPPRVINGVTIPSMEHQGREFALCLQVVQKLQLQGHTALQVNIYILEVLENGRGALAMIPEFIQLTGDRWKITSPYECPPE